MPPFDFPSAPIVGEEYTGFGVTYRFTGKVWNLKPEASPEYVLKAGDTMTGPLVLSGDAVTALEAVPLQQVTAGFVAKPGDTMTGALRLPLALPIAPEEAAHKQYVDQSIAAASLYQGPWQVAANIPDLDPAVRLPLHTYSWIAQTVDKDLPEIAPPTLPGIGGQNVASGDTIVWNANTLVYDQIRAPASTAGYLPLVGGTLTGTLNGTNIRSIGDGTVGQLWMSAGDASRTGNLEWRMTDGARQAYMGWAQKSNYINFKTEDGCKGLYMDGGADLYMGDNSGLHWGNTSAKTDVNDFSEGICLYGYGGTSQFGFNITSGTLNISVQNAVNKVDVNVGGATQLRVQQGTSYVYSNLSCAGTITSTVAKDVIALQLNDGARIDFSSGCIIRKVHGSNQFQHHTNAGQVYVFHISGFGDAWVIDTVGATGNSFSATAPEALALGAELGVARRKPETESTLEGVDVVKMIAACVAKIKLLEAELAALKGTPR